MSRVITPLTLQAMFSRETGNGPILLLTIDAAPMYPGGPKPPGVQPILVTSDIPPGWGDGTNPPGTVSRGNTFIPYPFRVALLSNDPDTLPTAPLEIDNIDRRILAALQAIAPTPITVTIEMVTFLLPDTVDWTSGLLTMRSVSADDLVIQGQLRLEELLSEPSPGDVVSPSTDPGSFLIQ